MLSFRRSRRSAFQIAGGACVLALLAGAVAWHVVRSSGGVFRTDKGAVSRIGDGSVAIDAVFSPDGDTIAIAGEDGSTGLWDVGDNRMIGKLTGHTGKVYGLSFSRDSRTLATAGEDGTVRLWDVRKRSAIGVLTGHTKAVRDVAFSPDGKALASAGEDNTARLWDRAKRSVTATLPGNDTEPFASVYQVLYTPDGKRLITQDTRNSGSVWLWSLSKSNPKPTPLLSGYAGTAILTPDGLVISTDGDNGTVEARWLERPERWPNWGKGIRGAPLALAHDGTTLAVDDDDDTPALGLYDVENGRRIGSSPRALAKTMELDFSSDGRHAVAVRSDGTVMLWRLT